MITLVENRKKHLEYGKGTTEDWRKRILLHITQLVNDNISKEVKT